MFVLKKNTNFVLVKKIQVKKVLIIFILCSAYTFHPVMAQKGRILVNHFGPEEGWYDPGVNCLAQDSRGFIWIGATSGLTRFDGVHFRTFPMPLGGKGSFVYSPRCMDIDSDDRIWIGTKRGLFCFDIQTEIFHRYNKAVITDSMFIHSVRTASNGQILVTTDSLCFRINAKTGSCRQLEKDSTVYSVRGQAQSQIKQTEEMFHNAGLDNVTARLQDEDGGWWIGTFFDGLFYIHPDISPFVTITDSEIKSKLLITRQICSCDNNMYIGTENLGLCTLMNDDGKSLRLDHIALSWNGRQISENVQAVIPVDGHLWIGMAGEGIYVFDPRTKRLTHHYTAESKESGLTSNSIVCMLKTRCGDIMVGTKKGLMVKYQNDTCFRSVTGLEHGMVHALTETGNGMVWVGRLEEPMLCLKRGNDDTWSASDAGFKHQCVTAMTTTPDGDLWVGTDCKGVWRMRNHGNFEQTHLTYNVLHSSVKTMLSDNNGNLWVSTNNGLFCYDIGHENIQHFTAALNGLPTDQMNYFSGYLDHDGSIYMGTYRGLVQFHPSQIRLRPIFLRPYFTNVRIGLKDTLATPQLTLDYDSPSIRIEYGVPNYSRKKNIWFRYRLEGAPLDNWITMQAGDQSIYISHLSPGHYKIILQVSQNPNRWEDATQAEMQIMVKPPFWLSVWGIIIYIIVFFLIVALLLRAWHHRIERRNLRSQIDNLLQNKEFMRNTPTATPYDLIKNIANSRTENQLMKQIDEFLEHNCMNSQLQVELIAEHLNMSKSTLYRKMHQVTSISPNDYIRLFRLKRAARMLREEGMSIREVSDTLCFSSVAYFTNSFSQQFGITPGEYKKTTK